MNLISNKTRIFEIIVVCLTAAGKFIAMDFLNWRLFYVIFTIVVWLVYIIYKAKKNSTIFKYWGFRIDNFKITIVMMLPFIAIAVFSFVVVGLYQKTINMTWHMLPLLLLYPIWGIIQQFLVIALIAGNLKDFKDRRINKYVIIGLTALLFSAVHYPSIWLMIGTFILALFYGHVYLKQKNIYALGITHGWLAAIFYYTVVDRDPFQEVFLKLFQ